MWAGHIVDYYNAINCRDVNLEILPMNDTKTNVLAVGISKPQRIIRGIRMYLNILLQLKRIIKSTEYDTIHIVSSASISLLKDICMVRMIHKRGIKSIVHFHFGRIPELAQVRNWEWKLLVKVVKSADQVVVIDKASYDTLREKGFNNIRLLPNPVAPHIVEIAAENAEVKKAPRSIIFVGHVVKTKGVFELLEACSKIENINLQLVGYITPEMQVQIETKYRNAHWLTICGEKPYEDVIKEMCKCDVFVLPTYTEGFPNVILESMACGCAIVTTPVGAIPEMLEEEDGKHYGIMVEPRNVEQLKGAIERMLSDADFKNECRANVQQRVNERYNIDSVWRQMVDIWSETIAQ